MSVSVDIEVPPTVGGKKLTKREEHELKKQEHEAKKKAHEEKKRKIEAKKQKQQQKEVTVAIEEPAAEPKAPVDYLSIEAAEVAKLDETKVEEVKVEPEVGLDLDVGKVENVDIEVGVDAKVEDVPVDSVPVEDAPVDSVPVEDAPMDSVPVEDYKTEEVKEEKKDDDNSTTATPYKTEVHIHKHEIVVSDIPVKKPLNLDDLLRTGAELKGREGRGRPIPVPSKFYDPNIITFTAHALCSFMHALNLWNGFSSSTYFTPWVFFYGGICLFFGGIFLWIHLKDTLAGLQSFFLGSWWVTIALNQLLDNGLILHNKALLNSEDKGSIFAVANIAFFVFSMFQTIWAGSTSFVSFLMYIFTDLACFGGMMSGFDIGRKGFDIFCGLMYLFISLVWFYAAFSIAMRVAFRHNKFKRGPIVVRLKSPVDLDLIPLSTEEMYDPYILVVLSHAFASFLQVFHLWRGYKSTNYLIFYLAIFGGFNLIIGGIFVWVHQRNTLKGLTAFFFASFWLVTAFNQALDSGFIPFNVSLVKGNDAGIVFALGNIGFFIFSFYQTFYGATTHITTFCAFFCIDWACFCAMMGGFDAGRTGWEIMTGVFFFLVSIICFYTSVVSAMKTTFKRNILSLGPALIPVHPV